MTRDELMKLATAYADASERIRVWGLMQSPNDPARKLELDAAYIVARSVLEKARSEYETAIGALSASDLDFLMRPAAGRDS